MQTFVCLGLFHCMPHLVVVVLALCACVLSGEMMHEEKTAKYATHRNRGRYVSIKGDAAVLITRTGFHCEKAKSRPQAKDYYLLLFPRDIRKLGCDVAD